MPSAPADLGLVMVSDCNEPRSCLDFHNAIGPGEVSEMPLHRYPAGRYFLYVDSYYATGPASCGDYLLEATVLPVELLRFTIE